MSRTKRLIEWIYSTPIPPGVQDFDSLVMTGAMKGLGMSSVEAGNYASRSSRTVWNAFLKVQTKSMAAKVYPLMEVMDNRTRKVRSTASKWSNGNGVRGKRIGSRLQGRSHVYKEIVKADHRLYEAMCCVAAKANGATRVSLTPSGDEGGVDFYSLIEVPKGYLKCSGLNTIRVVGQSKKYTKPVSMGDIREFDSALNAVRCNGIGVRDHVPAWFLDVQSPIVGWFFGHNGFQAGAIGVASIGGIMLFDSKVLAEMIVVSDVVESWKEDPFVGKQFRANALEYLHSAS